MAQVSKLRYVDSKLGAPTTGQQTTRVIWNTIENPGTTSSLEFFKNFQGLTPGQTNLQNNKLDSMESMVVKSLWFCQLDANGVLTALGGSVAQTVSVFIGNEQVVKNLPIHFNQGFNGQAFDRLHFNAGINADGVTTATANAQVAVPCEVRLLTDIVLPPQVTIKVVVESNSAGYGAGAVVCALSGYGKIFSAGSSF